jgi:hypothetical protein
MPRLVGGPPRPTHVGIEVDPEIREILVAMAQQRRVSVPRLLGAYVTAFAVRSPEGKRRRLYLHPVDASIVDAT